MQEFFAAMQFLKVSNTEFSLKRNLIKVKTDGRLNMLQLFVFGAAFDLESQVLQGMKLPICGSPSSSDLSEQGLRMHLKRLAQEAESKHQKLLVAQIAYEGQNPSLVDLVTEYLTKNGEIEVQDIPLNALDLKALGFVLSASKFLRKVTMRNVNLDGYSVGILTKSLEGNKLLECLDLSDNRDMKADGMKAIGNLLRNNLELVDLHLDGNSITAEMLENLGPGLSQARDRLSLSLRDNDIKDEGAEALVTMLSAVESISALDLGHNNIGQNGINKTCTLCPKMKDIKLLALDGNSVTDEDLRQLITALPDKVTLNSLSLNDTQITDTGASIISEILPNMKNLQYIGLSNCQIGTSGAQKMIQSCKENTPDVMSDLSDNQIDLDVVETSEKVKLASNCQALKRCIKIAKDITKGKSFKVLNLSSTDLNKTGVKVIADALLNNSVIEELILNDNDHIDDEIKELLQPLMFTCRNLKKVGLAGTGVTETIQKEFCDMSVRYRLTILSLSEVKLTLEGIEAIADFLANDGIALCSLTIEMCEMEDAGADALTLAMTINSTILFLNLSGNKIGDEGIKAFVLALAFNETLTELNLADNSIGTSGGSEVFIALKQNKTLRSLRLDGNPIQSDCAEALNEALETNTTLAHLNISRTQIGHEIGPGIAKNKSLTNINMANNKIGKSPTDNTFCLALPSNVTLTDVNLAYSSIGLFKVAEKIGEALECTNSLTNLNLSHCVIGRNGSEFIGNGLAKNKSLLSLNLNGNLLSDKGAVSMGRALAVNNTLKELILDNNRLSDEQGEAIGLGLPENTSLTSISLKYNQLGDKSAFAFAAGLATNDTLATVNLDGNLISSEGEMAIVNALLEKNKLPMLISMTEKSEWYDVKQTVATALVEEALRKKTKLTDLFTTMGKRLWEDSNRVIAIAVVEKGIDPLLDLTEWQRDQIANFLTKIL